MQRGAGRSSWLVSTEIAPQDEAALTATGNGLLSNRNDNLGRFETRNELIALSQRWKELAATQADLKVSAFMLVLDDGRYAQLEPDTALPAASSIKTPILL